MNLENKILQKIKDENLQPKSFWYFLAKDYSLWGLVLISILLAAVAMAPIIFILQNLELDNVKHISQNYYLFILFLIPYQWIILFCITTFLATLSWEKTKHGYRFNGKYVFICSFLSALILAIFLNLWHLGQMADEQAGSLSRGNYKSFEERRDENWFRPEEGRFVGIISSVSTSSFLLRNYKNDFQEIIFFDTSVPGTEFVDDNNKVRVVGFQNNANDFIACVILPDNLLPPHQRKIDDKEKEERKQKFQQIFETYPECKEIFDNGRANFRSKNFMK